MENNFFGKNTASISGGSLFISGLKIVNIENNKFIENSAIDYGGSIWFSDSSSSENKNNLTQLLIKNNTFSNNTSKLGSAISI